MNATCDPWTLLRECEPIYTTKTHRLVLPDPAVALEAWKKYRAGEPLELPEEPEDNRVQIGIHRHLTGQLYLLESFEMDSPPQLRPVSVAEAGRWMLKSLARDDGFEAHDWDDFLRSVAELLPKDKSADT